MIIIKAAVVWIILSVVATGAWFIWGVWYLLSKTKGDDEKFGACTEHIDEFTKRVYGQANAPASQIVKNIVMWPKTLAEVTEIYTGLINEALSEN